MPIGYCLTLHDAPGVLPAPDTLARDVDDAVTADDGEGDGGLQLSILLLELLVFVCVALRELVDLRGW